MNLHHPVRRVLAAFRLDLLIGGPEDALELGYEVLADSRFNTPFYSRRRVHGVADKSLLPERVPLEEHIFGQPPRVFGPSLLLYLPGELAHLVLPVAGHLQDLFFPLLLLELDLP